MKKIRELFKVEKLNQIKISEEFKEHPPKASKMRQREAFYKFTNIFYTTIVIDKNNVLVDGYTSYLIAQKYKKIYVKVIRKDK